MDTRQKIVSLDMAAEKTASGRWAIVLAWLDPLTAETAQQIAEVARLNPGRSLCTVVLESKSALLPGNVRTALAAALRSVELVTSACQETAQATWHSDGDRLIIVDLSSQGARSSQDFVDLVIAKQQTVAV